jgi:hypothetical protein
MCGTNPATVLAERRKTDFVCGIPTIPRPRENTGIVLEDFNEILWFQDCWPGMPCDLVLHINLVVVVTC